MNYYNLKSLDLHGESKEIAKILVLEFLEDCSKMKEEKIVIVHGIGTGVLKRAVQDVLKNHPKVEEYYIDFFNEGQTIVKLKNNN